MTAPTTPHQLFIGGAWRDASTGATFDVVDPATGEVIAAVADASVADGAAALDTAVAAQAEWGATAPARGRRSCATRSTS
ncbi:hypothetical protein GCM10025875_11470 [Litorihabitans aurantiacus]|uniref:Aldehyde dehydrogenase domain-containing protein n=1 Tax=Litorihabitans aurantiacus TaxID=1930061 RepID=A0AA37XDE8_9MICO|nr:hypothetical protein GCM10025875_11470 [Litorihabitans aurantiacus]